MNENFVTSAIAQAVFRMGYKDKLFISISSKVGGPYHDNVNDQGLFLPLWQNVIDWLYTEHNYAIIYCPDKNKLANRIMKAIDTIFVNLQKQSC